MASSSVTLKDTKTAAQFLVLGTAKALYYYEPVNVSLCALGYFSGFGKPKSSTRFT
jgi:hypothetical protein